MKLAEITEMVDPKDFIMGMPEWEFTFYLYYPEYYDEGGLTLLRKKKAVKYKRVFTAASKAQAKKQFYEFLKTVPPYLAFGEDGTVVEKPHTDTVRIENIRQISESVDPKEFIMGDFPAGDLVKRGFQQDSTNEFWYLKQLSNGYLIWVSVGGGTVDKGPYDERSYLDVYSKDRQRIIWSSVAPHGLVAKAVDAIEQILLGPFENETVLYKKLDALNDGKSQLRMNEADEPKAFIMGSGPWFEFKTRMKELGWVYIGIAKTPTIHGTTVDVHQFKVTSDFFHFSADAGEIHYTAYASEFVEHGQQRLSVYAGGVKEMDTGKVNAFGEAVYTDVAFEVDEHLQPDNMSGAEFAELMNDAILAETGPDEPPQEEES